MAKNQKRTAAYLTMGYHAKAWGLSVCSYIVLNEIRSGNDKHQQLGGLGFNQANVEALLRQLASKNLIEPKSGGGFQISETGENLYQKEIVLPWAQDEQFWETWQLWLDYRKETFGSVYKPIGHIAALRNLVKLSEGELEVAIEGLIWTMDKGWKGFNYGIAEYLKERVKRQPESKIDGRRNSIAEEINRRHRS